MAACIGFTTATTLVSASSFYCLFWDCTGLTDASELALPATTLAESCYNRMFYNCKQLTAVSELPATSMTLACYAYMFYGCTSLTTPPELPATSGTTNQCYTSMFEECTNLERMPVIYITTLAASSLGIGCCERMFYGCSKIQVSSSSNTTTYSFRFRIPARNSGTATTNWNKDMFKYTGGSYVGNPTANSYYYTENAPV